MTELIRHNDGIIALFKIINDIMALLCPIIGNYALGMRIDCGVVVESKNMLNLK